MRLQEALRKGEVSELEIMRCTAADHIPFFLQARATVLPISH